MNIEHPTSNIERPSLSQDWCPRKKRRHACGTNRGRRRGRERERMGLPVWRPAFRVLRLSVRAFGRIFERLQLATFAFVWLRGVKVKDGWRLAGLETGVTGSSNRAKVAGVALVLSFSMSVFIFLVAYAFLLSQPGTFGVQGSRFWLVDPSERCR